MVRATAAPAGPAALRASPGRARTAAGARAAAVAGRSPARVGSAPIGCASHRRHHGACPSDAAGAFRCPSPTASPTFLDEFFARYPHWRHLHRRAPPRRPLARHERERDGGRGSAWIDRWAADLATLDPPALTPDERLDRDLLLGELDALRFAESDLRDDAWDAMDWVYLLGFGLFPLTARSFAPLAERLASLAGRLEGIPAMLDDARTTLGSHAAASGGTPARRDRGSSGLRESPSSVAMAWRRPKPPPGQAISPTEAVLPAAAGRVRRSRRRRSRRSPRTLRDVRRPGRRG